jgi:hypothetical protein
MTRRILADTCSIRIREQALLWFIISRFSAQFLTRVHALPSNLLISRAPDWIAAGVHPLDIESAKTSVSPTFAG